MNDEEEFFRNAREKMFPQMKESATAVIICSNDPDPKLCMEVGAALLFDKPIIVVVPEGRRIPSNLSRIASAVVHADPSDLEKLNKRLKESIDRVLKNDMRTKH